MEDLNVYQIIGEQQVEIILLRRALAAAEKLLNNKDSEEVPNPVNPEAEVTEEE